MLQDVYGNQYTYSQPRLGLQRLYPVPKRARPASHRRRAIRTRASRRQADPKPTAPASAGRQRRLSGQRRRRRKSALRSANAPKLKLPRSRPQPPVAYKERLFAHPSRPRRRVAGGLEQIFNARPTADGFATYDNYFAEALGLNAKNSRLRR